MRVPIRLAMRVEGEFWNAYLAYPDTMEDAMLLGSIRFQEIHDNEARKKAFLRIMQDCMDAFIERSIGVKPTSHTERPAPEHERSGNA